MDTRGRPIRHEYDYIVVGAGSAGCAVAARLAEDIDCTVLLIEAGPANENDAAVNIPAACLDLQLTDRDWQFRSEPLKYMNNRISNWPRGKMLGGCSSSNATIAVRGDPENFNAWERMGCTGWNYETLLPYFKKLENCDVPSRDLKYRGVGGPVQVTEARKGDINPAARAFIAAAQEVGLPRNDDYNGPVLEGVGVTQVTVGDGVRSSTSAAYVRPNLLRTNFTVMAQAHVTKVLFQGNTAIGVSFRSGSHAISILRDKPEQLVYAKREVILAGGAVNTPWLLMLSGIGPAKHLEEHGIPVVVDLPGVGQNLQDHLFTPLSYEFLQPITYDGSSILFKISTLIQYMLFKTGPASSPALEALAFSKTGILTKENTAVDHQIHFASAIFNSDKDLEKFGYSASNGTHCEWDKNPRYGVIFFTTLLQPKSVGYIELKSKDPFTYPKIEPNYLADETDLDVMVAGIKQCRAIAKAKAFEGLIGKEITDKKSPFRPETDEYIKDFLRNTAVTVYHPVGTAKMGPKEDPMAVVDHRLRVYGVKGLRVVDCSVMPKIPSANTNLPAIAVGERAADLIRMDYPSQTATPTKL